MLRRLKTDVDLIIPPKREVIVYVSLTPRQHKIYHSILDKTIMEEMKNKCGKVEILI